MDRGLLLEKLQELPLYFCDFIDPKALEFSGRIRWICENECPMYGKTWACPPGVGTVEACAICEHCAYLDGQPCRYPEKMHPCVESHGINILPLLEELGLPFQFGENVVTWVSLLFFKDGK